jgi:E3 ubiquitin-protein ligase MARCH6
MEWLSHSQKKHCELCKTPFRFTKLYHPHMPSRIPTAVFLRRGIVHVLKLIMTWCRILLVASVWLVLVPWCMRVVWRSLFWVADGGWSRDFYMEKEQLNTTSSSRLDKAIKSMLDNAKTSYSTAPLPLATVYTSVHMTFNMSSFRAAEESGLWTLVKRFFFGMSDPHQDSQSPTGANMTNSSPSALSSFASSNRNPSLLSDVAFFNWFASPAANRFLIDVLEGQIITLLVVIAFVLIFLIREWVVQQQPVINMMAVGADNVPVPAPIQPVDVVQPEEGVVEERDAPLSEEEDNDENIADDTPSSQDESERDQQQQEIPTVSNHATASSANGQLKSTQRSSQLGEGLPEELRLAMERHSNEDILRILNGMTLEEIVQLRQKLNASAMETIGQERELIPSSAARSNSDPTIEAQRPSELLKSHDSGTLAARLADMAASPEMESGDASVPRQRPNMPARDQSFIATEIRRGLEEGTAWSFPNQSWTSEGDAKPSREGNSPVPDSWEDEDEDEDEQEKDSDHSSDSWQHVSNTPADDSMQSKLEAVQSSVKGKAKVSDEVPEGLLEQMEEAGSSEERADSSDLPAGRESRLVKPSVAESVVEPDTTASHTQDEIASPQHSQQEMAREDVRHHIGLAARVMDWLWGDIAPDTAQGVDDEGNDEHVVQNLADEPPFVPFVPNAPRDAANPPIQNAEVAAAAAQAGIDLNDQDAIDDAEDLEGIMELIGMQGPLTGLFQNAMFSAVLISASVACAVWFPYLWGKVVLLLIGSPLSVFVKLPIRLVAGLTDLVVDLTLGFTAGVALICIKLFRNFLMFLPLGRLSKLLEKPIAAILTPAESVAGNAQNRIGGLLMGFVSALSSPNYSHLSINSHAALRHIQNTTSTAITQTGEAVIFWYKNATFSTTAGTATWAIRRIPSAVQLVTATVLAKAQQMVSWIWTSKSYQITLDLGQGIPPTYSAVEHWTAKDRLITILAGYACFAVAGALYLRRGAPFTTSQHGRRIEGTIADILQQAGGVLKVILIISIEMLAFPLYCGLLLDVALLPLFENTTLWSRCQFTWANPWTSGFVHWFIGTCYMFHFALFVSMCRKIMRRGVLYFIRDPDDPTFHPVRDVLERSVTTQLRKIAFSALVYGGLVVVCLGGVVWGLNRCFQGVLPIHWANHTPSLEFPVDLLFYNFLTPLVIKIYKPSEGLYDMYQWWFQSCGKFLRLSSFLFGERVDKEEGHHVRPTWSSWLSGEKGDVTKPVMPADQKKLAGKPPSEVYFAFDGKYVRAPASDQLRIPKGEAVFVEVDQDNNRLDGNSEQTGVHAKGSSMVELVYIPPWFRLRIALFVFTIWMFAAVTGVGSTVGPLLFGRYLFSIILPPGVVLNDIHAFSLGIYTLGGLAYGVYQLYNLAATLRDTSASSPLHAIQTAWTAVSTTGFRVIRVAYVYTSLVLLIPILFALILELYILIPLHAYFGAQEPHVVHLVQDWTLGFLYARLAARLVFFDRASRPARAFSAVIADGYTNPNARLATRCFLIPVLACSAVAILVPSGLAWTLNRTLWINASDAFKSQIWRFSYPSLALFTICVWAAREGASMMNRWRMVVRDEVYLIGERLHNFGEKRANSGIRRMSGIGRVEGIGRVGEAA